MATFLDLSVLENFRVIFTFILVYALVYGVLEVGKPLGKASKGLHSVISLAISVMAVTFEPVVRMVNFSVPWFFIIMLIGFFIIFIVKLFGGSELDLQGFVSKDSRVTTWVIVLFIVVILFGLGQAFGSQTLESGQWETAPSGGDGSISGTDQFINSTGLGNTGTTGSNVATDNFDTNVLNTLVNPKVLGMILIMLVGVFAIFFITN